MHTGRVSHPANMPTGGRIIAPSALALAGQMYSDAEGMQDHPVPQEMTLADIEATKSEFVTAAKDAIAAGFDGIELHGANGYLLEQFLSPHTNQRSDAYGGSVANRIRFVVEVAKAVAAAIGGDKVGIRLSPYGMASGMTPYPEVDETYLTLTKALAEAGLIYLHIANHAAMGNPPIPAALLASLRAAWPRTFFLGGSFDLASGQAAVDAGESDLVGIGRAFIANPDLVARLKKGTPLATMNADALYSHGPVGYSDYANA
jgi:N-ethylmaleimide reductase